MSPAPLPFLRTLCLLALGLILLSGTARADLVWTPDTGWRVVGGTLSGLTGSEGDKALALMNKARRAEEAQHWYSALRTYSKVAKKYPSSIYAPEALYRTGEMYLKRKEYLKAFENFQNCLGHYPSEKRFTQIVIEEYKIASMLLDGAHGRLWGLIPTFTNREKAVGCFEAIYSNAPYGEYAPLALMNASRGAQYLGSVPEAVDALDRLVSNFPQSPIAPDAYLRLAELHASLVQGPYYDQAETKQAITYQDDFMILFPNDPKIGVAAQGLDNMKKMLAESKMKIGDFYFYKRDNYTAARVFYNEAITSYPDSEVAKRARQRLALVEVKANQAANPPPAAPNKKHFLIF
jgi:outer membrane protein assembly factor BamD